MIPDDRLLIESDAPYLAPDPHRGTRYQPSFLALTAARIAEIRDCESGDIARITEQNTRRLFSIPEEDL